LLAEPAERENGDERAVEQIEMADLAGYAVFFGNSYGLGQSQLLWDLRTEPGVLAAFEKLWGTSELVVSFDGESEIFLYDQPFADVSPLLQADPSCSLVKVS
jgi:hypothetical protein